MLWEAKSDAISFEIAANTNSRYLVAVLTDHLLVIPAAQIKPIVFDCSIGYLEPLENWAAYAGNLRVYWLTPSGVRRPAKSRMRGAVMLENTTPRFWSLISAASNDSDPSWIPVQAC